jgi:hypothetical protein
VQESKDEDVAADRRFGRVSKVDHLPKQACVGKCANGWFTVLSRFALMIDSRGMNKTTKTLIQIKNIDVHIR